MDYCLSQKLPAELVDIICEKTHRINMKKVFKEINDGMVFEFFKVDVIGIEGYFLKKFKRICYSECKNFDYDRILYSDTYDKYFYDKKKEDDCVIMKNPINIKLIEQIIR